MEINKEYSELFEISDFKNDYFLLFGYGRAYIPKIKEEYATNDFMPYLIVSYFDNEDYELKNELEIKISLLDYDIIYPILFLSPNTSECTSTNTSNRTIKLYIFNIQLFAHPNLIY